MTQTAVAAEVHQALHVHLHFAAQVAFDGEVRVDVLTDLEHLGIGKLIHASGLIDANGFTDFASGGMANASDIGQRDWNALGGGDVNPCNTCQRVSSFKLRARSSRPFFHNEGSKPSERLDPCFRSIVANANLRTIKVSRREAAT